jgi:hypothetical protein
MTTAPVAVGDQLLVIRPFSRYRSNNPIEVVVTKAARVWIEMEEINQVPSQRRKWRMRRNMQNDGNGDRYHTDRFVTAEQYAHEQRVEAAETYLRREAKACPDFASPWFQDKERLIALANFLRRHDGLSEI